MEWLSALDTDSVYWHGDKLDTDTVDSLPSGNLICAKFGLASISSTVSTRSWVLFLMNFLSWTRSGCTAQWDNDRRSILCPSNFKIAREVKHWWLCITKIVQSVELRAKQFPTRFSADYNYIELIEGFYELFGVFFRLENCLWDGMVSFCW